MRYLVTFGLVALTSFCTDAQETLESTTSRDNTTTKSVYIRTANKLNEPYHSLVIGQRPLGDGIASLWLTGRNNNDNGGFGAVYHNGNDNTLRLYNLIDAVTIKTNGHVGIGTAAPEYRLSVSGDSHTFTQVASTDGNAGIYLKASGTSYYPHMRFDQGASGKMEMGVDPQQGFYLNHNVSSGSHNADLYITPDKRVGIGTTSPEQKLSVKSDTHTFAEVISSAGHAGIYLKASSISYYPHLRFDQGGSGKMEMGVDPQQGFYLNHSTSSGSSGADLYITSDKNVGVGTNDTKGYKLAVAGKLRATEVRVDALPWPDYVFAPGYKLVSLQETAQFIKENKHLPGIPSASEVAKEGIGLGDMNAKLLQKIEELTLHVIELNKRLEDQDKRHRKEMQQIKHHNK